MRRNIHLQPLDLDFFHNILPVVLVDSTCLVADLVDRNIHKAVVQEGLGTDHPEDLDSNFEAVRSHLRDLGQEDMIQELGHEFDRLEHQVDNMGLRRGGLAEVA